MPVELKCQRKGCNNTFTISPQKAKTAKYCSPECSKKAKQKLNEEQELNLCREYENGKSTRQLAKKYKLAKKTVQDYLNRNNISLRPPCISPFSKKEEQIICKEYVSGHNTPQLSKKYKVSPQTISDILKRNNIVPRSSGDSKRKFSKKEEQIICNDYLNGLSSIKLSKKYNVNKTTILRILKDNNIPRREIGITRRAFNEKEEKDICSIYLTGISAHQLAKKYDVADITILKVLYRHEIPIRDISGENNHNWNNGSSYAPYCHLFNKDLKERVRLFWNRECAICGKTEKQNGKKLSVHHVNYEKKVCCDDELIQSVQRLFMPLCQSCHAKTNHNREYWEEMLTNYIMIWFNGESYLPNGN